LRIVENQTQTVFACSETNAQKYQQQWRTKTECDHAGKDRQTNQACTNQDGEVHPIHRLENSLLQVTWSEVDIADDLWIDGGSRTPR